MTFFNAGVYFLGGFIDLSYTKMADILIVILLSTWQISFTSLVQAKMLF